MYLPIAGAFLEAAGVILEKKILRIRNINYKNYTVFEFLAIFLMCIPFVYFTWRVDEGALSLLNIGIFGFIIALSIMANFLIFYSLKRESITVFEPIVLMQPFFIVILAFIFYEGERNLTVAGLALIASLALVFAHVKKHHFYFDKYMTATLIGSLFFAVELVTSKQLLRYYSPFSFYFIRSLFIFIATLIIVRPSFKKLERKTGGLILIVGLIWVLYRGIIYYGYQSLGIVFTTTLVILAPVLIMGYAVFFLKEKMNLRQIISTIVIVLCVLASIIVQS